MRYLAIDFGARRIGLAVSDPEGNMAFPHSTRERGGHKKDTAAIIEAVRGLGIEAIVFGLPHSLAKDGVASDSESKVRAFAVVLEEALRAENMPQPLEWWDERFSTREALGGMREAGISQRQGREASGDRSVDARAASVILQGFLDSRKRQAGQVEEDTESDIEGNEA